MSLLKRKCEPEQVQEPELKQKQKQELELEPEQTLPNTTISKIMIPYLIIFIMAVSKVYNDNIVIMKFVNDTIDRIQFCLKHDNIPLEQLLLFLQENETFIRENNELFTKRDEFTKIFNKLGGNQVIDKLNILIFCIGNGNENENGFGNGYEIGNGFGNGFGNGYEIGNGFGNGYEIVNGGEELEIDVGLDVEMGMGTK